MGRRQVSTADLQARAQAKGYRRGAHEVQDRLKDDRKHNGTTKKNHASTLYRYVRWRLTEMEEDCRLRGLSIPTEDDVRTQYLCPGVQTPDLATIKDFLRFYVATSTPRLTDIPTVKSINTIAEWFFAGFERATGTVIPLDNRSEVYSVCFPCRVTIYAV